MSIWVTVAQSGSSREERTRLIQPEQSRPEHVAAGSHRIFQKLLCSWYLQNLWYIRVSSVCLITLDEIIIFRRVGWSQITAGLHSPHSAHLISDRLQNSIWGGHFFFQYLVMKADTCTVSSEGDAFSHTLFIATSYYKSKPYEELLLLSVESWAFVY